MRTLLALLLMTTAAYGTWKPEYASLPQEVQDWYRNAELTEAAQKRLGFSKCCAQSEVVKTRFHVNKKNGADEWFYLTPKGEWKRIPPDIIHWGEGAPSGQPTLFVLPQTQTETCFYPGKEGI